MVNYAGAIQSYMWLRKRKTEVFRFITAKYGALVERRIRIPVRRGFQGKERCCSGGAFSHLSDKVFGHIVQVLQIHLFSLEGTGTFSVGKKRCRNVGFRMTSGNQPGHQ